ncbi:MAG: hypothetical protein R2939_04415 [Kofleriaceae bacterium]
MAKVKGSTLTSRLLWVRLGHGEAGMARLLTACTPALRATVEAGVRKADWYPFELFVELCEAIDRTFGAGDGALFRPLARHGAEANLTTIYRLFYKVGTVHWILGRAARLFGAHYDSGRLEVRATGMRSADLELVDVATPSCVHCEAVAGWAERSAELSGGSACSATRIACRREGADRCTLRTRWE